MMSDELKLHLPANAKVRRFMTAEQYRAFAEKFQQEVKPDLDRQREARIRSEEQAKRHFVS